MDQQTCHGVTGDGGDVVIRRRDDFVSEGGADPGVSLQRRLQAFEGDLVRVRLRDGSSPCDGRLISAGRPGVRTLWIFSGGVDRFVQSGDVVEVSRHDAPGDASGRRR